MARILSLEDFLSTRELKKVKAWAEREFSPQLHDRRPATEPRPLVKLKPKPTPPKKAA